MKAFNKYVDINKRSLLLAMTECIRPMQEFYDPKRRYLPFFHNSMTKGEHFGNRHHDGFSVSHIPGRWLNGLLNIENLLDLPIDENAINNLRYWAFESLEGAAIGFPACIDTKNENMVLVKKTDLHNLREVMHALVALSAYRGDKKAFELACNLISCVDKYFDYDNCIFKEQSYMDDTGAQATCCAAMPNEKFPFPATFGRYIGPLVKFYRTTGYSKAIIQAIKLKDACFRKILNKDGELDVRIFGNHTHSITSMMSSLALLGETIRDDDILRRVHSFMGNGLKSIALDFGWCIENYQRTDFVGEINNTVDIMETCLILAKAGFPNYYARAEKIIRTHLLPAQLLDTSFIPDCNDPNDSGNFQLAKRSKGAFGFPCPFGHEDHPGSDISFNWDIVGGGAEGLCEAWKERTTVESNLVSINLLFDYEDQNIVFSNPYDGLGMASIILKKPVTIRVRIPGNCSDQNIRINGGKFEKDNQWIYIFDGELGKKISIDFALQEKFEYYSFRDKSLKFRYWGEEITGAVSVGKRLCYFPEIDA